MKQKVKSIKAEARAEVQYIAAVKVINKITVDSIDTDVEMVTIHMDNGFTQEQNIKLAEKIQDLINSQF